MTVAVIRGPMGATLSSTAAERHVVYAPTTEPLLASSTIRTSSTRTSSSRRSPTPTTTTSPSRKPSPSLRRSPSAPEPTTRLSSPTRPPGFRARLLAGLMRMLPEQALWELDDQPVLVASSRGRRSMPETTRPSTQQSQRHLTPIRRQGST